MSKVHSLEKELYHLAKRKELREQALLGPAAAPSRDGSGPTATQHHACAGASSPSSSGSSHSCETASSSSDTDGAAREGQTHMARSTNSMASRTFPSPNSTGSRFDLLMEGGGPCTRAEVRRATTAATRQSAKPRAAEEGGSNSNHSAHGHGDGGAAAGLGGPPSALPPPLKPDPSLAQISIPSQPPFRRLLRQPFSHVLVCDFEATCESGSVSYAHEIIEFPVVVLDTVSLQVVAEFHSYVRPVKNPTLTKFCTELTGITQAMVDAADPLPVVVERFTAWLREVLYPLCRAWRMHYAHGSASNSARVDDDSLKDRENKSKTGLCKNEVAYCSFLAHNLRNEQKRFTYDDRTAESSAERNEEAMICFATDGPWDMRRFMHECGVLRDGVDFPPVCYRYINVRHSFCDFFKGRQIKLTHMLKKLHMDFEGQRHSGIDDTRNIARVLAELFARGYRVHHVSTIKYAHRGDAFLATNLAAQELLAEYGEGDEPSRTNRHPDRNRSGKNARKNLPRNKQQPRHQKAKGRK